MRKIRNMDEIFMELALEQAKKSLRDDALPVGAIITLENNVISNGRRTGGRENKLFHAEILALMGIFGKYSNIHKKNMIIYTTLEPCVMCFGAILYSRIGEIVYSLEDPYGGATKSYGNPLPSAYSPPYIRSGVLRDETAKMFREYFKTTENKFWRDNYDNPLVNLCFSNDRNTKGTI